MANLALAQHAYPVVDVLLVEDSPSDAFVIETLLHESSAALYKMHCVASQSQAIKALAKQAFDVCLLDLTLPDTSGFSALIDIQYKAPNLPVLILTGTNNMALSKSAVGRGAQDYLLKDEIEATGLTRAMDYAMERKRNEKNLFQRANTDALTGLSNREAFMSRLKLALTKTERLGTAIGVLFIDLDHFKLINDTYGHEAGDEVLKTVANRIKATLRAYDMPARLGGDEFTVLLEDIPSIYDAEIIAKKLVRILAEPILFQHHNVNVTASIGVAFSANSIGEDALLKQADLAMYQAKGDGGNRYFIYEKSLNKQ